MSRNQAPATEQYDPEEYIAKARKTVKEKYGGDPDQEAHAIVLVEDKQFGRKPQRYGIVKISGDTIHMGGSYTLTRKDVIGYLNKGKVTVHDDEELFYMVPINSPITNIPKICIIRDSEDNDMRNPKNTVSIGAGYVVFSADGNFPLGDVNMPIKRGTVFGGGGFRFL